MAASLVVSIFGTLLKLYDFVRGARSKREDLEPVPIVTDDELWIVREMGKLGARREFHPQRASSGHSGNINSIWFGQTPVDREECPWIYDLMQKNLKQKGLIEQKGDLYSLTSLGERVYRANRRRKIRSAKPIIDARTGQPRQES